MNILRRRRRKNTASIKSTRIRLDFPAVQNHLSAQNCFPPHNLGRRAHMVTIRFLEAKEWFARNKLKIDVTTEWGDVCQAIMFPLASMVAETTKTVLLSLHPALDRWLHRGMSRTNVECRLRWSARRQDPGEWRVRKYESNKGETRRRHAPPTFED